MKLINWIKQNLKLMKLGLHYYYTTMNLVYIKNNIKIQLLKKLQLAMKHCV